MRYNINDPRDYIETMDFVDKCEKMEKDLTLTICTDNYDAIRAIIQTASVHRIKDIQMTRKRMDRTIPQNSYIHFLCRYFAAEYGCTTTEAKEVYLKRYAAPEIFKQTIINKFGNKIDRYRSISKLNSYEMSSAIRNFREWAALGGIDLPLSSDIQAVRHAERVIEDNENLI